MANVVMKLRQGFYCDCGTYLKNESTPCVRCMENEDEFDDTESDEEWEDE